MGRRRATQLKRLAHLLPRAKCRLRAKRRLARLPHELVPRGVGLVAALVVVWGDVRAVAVVGVEDGEVGRGDLGGWRWEV